MNIGIAVFAYNRSWHLGKVIEGLKENKGISKLYIFQDGLRCEEHRSEWEKTKQLIKKIDWCEVIYSLANYNQGLANAIVGGINTVLEENDAVVVLEDDCVPHPIFNEYMKKCLEKYQDEKRVFAINGYTWNFTVDNNGADAYFAGRFNSWGWATWKDRWQYYEQDYKILTRIQNDPQKKRRLDIWAQDAVSSLIGNVYGTCNSWAVFWGLKCIERGGFCVTPYYSLIDNIGCDGSGVHCGNAGIVTKLRAWDNMDEIVLPEKVEYPGNCEKLFSNEFHWINPEEKLNCYNKILCQWNALLQKGVSLRDYFIEDTKCIAIWGRGNLCKLLLNEIKDKIEVKYIIDSKKNGGYYENIPIISPDKITNEVQKIVIIPTYDILIIQELVEDDNVKSKMVGLDRILDCLSRK